MGFYYFDKDHPYTYPMFDENAATGVVKVRTLDDYVSGKEHLRQMQAIWEGMGERKEEQDDESFAVTEAIMEQEKQLSDYQSSLKPFDSKYFSENLEFLLKQHGMRISELEALLSVSQGYISRTIGTDSKKRLSIDIAWMIADVFNIKIDDLISRRINVESKDLKTVLCFLDKLEIETEREARHWKKTGTMPCEDNGILFRSTPHGEPAYAPNGEGLIMGEVEQIYTTTARIGDLFFVRYKALLVDNACDYAIYLYDEQRCQDMAMSGFDADPLIVMTKTEDDASHALRQKCESLEKTITKHEYDFTMDDLSRRYINEFLVDGNTGDDDLPFS